MKLISRMNENKVPEVLKMKVKEKYPTERPRVRGEQYVTQKEEHRNKLKRSCFGTEVDGKA
jgi:hypothetical protein